MRVGTGALPAAQDQDAHPGPPAARHHARRPGRRWGRWQAAGTEAKYRDRLVLPGSTPGRGGGSWSPCASIDAVDPERSTERAPGAPQLPRMPALDGVRALAVLAVMAYHNGFYVDPRRLLRGRRLLRPVRLPHHLPAPRRGGRHGHAQAPALLGAEGQAAPARALRAGRRARGGAPPLPVAPAVGRPGPRRRRHHRLRGQLALRGRQRRLLRRQRTALAAPAHVVAGDRGAVLPRVAAGGAGGHGPPGTRTPGPTAGGGCTRWGRSAWWGPRRRSPGCGT